MKQPYLECSNCIAVKWCKRYSGELPVPEYPTWCNPKFRLDKAINMSLIPKGYLNANIYNYKIDKENEELYKAIKPYIDNIVEEVEKGTNFLFTGAKTGIGKTFHATMLLNHYIYKTCTSSKFDFENPLALFIVYSDLMDDLRYRRDEDKVQDLLEQLKNVPFLLLDDIGSGTTSSFTVEQTYLILNYRKNNKLSTVFTTNNSLNYLAKEDVLGKRSVSRLSESLVFQLKDGRDRRTDKMRGVL